MYSVNSRCLCFEVDGTGAHLVVTAHIEYELRVAVFIGDEHPEIVVAREVELDVLTVRKDSACGNTELHVHTDTKAVVQILSVSLFIERENTIA